MSLVPFDIKQTENSYKNFYDNTNTTIPHFSGAKYQKGYGLGNILSNMMRNALPLIKQGAVTLGKSALQTGLNIAKDALSGENLKSSAKKNLKISAQNMINQASQHVVKKNKKRKHKAKSSSSGSSAKRKRTVHKDIFSK